MKTPIIAAAMVLGHIASASAQGTDPEHTPGTVRVVNEIASAPGLTAAQRAAATATTNRIIEILRRTAVMSNPVGYSVTIRATAHTRLPGDVPNIPYHTLVWVKSRYFGWSDNGRRGKSIDLDAGGLDLAIAVNTAGFPGEMENDEAEPDKGPRIMGADEGGLDVYRTTGSFHGRAIYGGSCTYLTHRTAAPIIPVTKARYLNVELLKLRGTQTHHESQRQQDGEFSSNARLQEFLQGRPAREAQNQKMFAELKKSGIDTAQLRQIKEEFAKAEKQQEAALRGQTTDGTDQRIQSLVEQGRAGEADRIAQKQAEIDALSPAERRSPVALIAHGRHEFSLAESVEDTTALPLMQPNAAFYDASLGADAVQLVWVCGYHFQGLEDRGYERLAEGSSSWRQEKAMNERRIRDMVRLRDQLDWSALDALLKP